MTAPEPINTFAFLDLETTGLPSMNFGKTSITELSMIACSSKDLKMLEDNKEIPRSAHKLTLCFNPVARIDPTASELSGLDNYILEGQNKFDGNAANVIKGFISHLPKPVCLVAHNGNNFDFPIFRKQLLKAGVDLPNDVLCIDSLNVFRKLDYITNSIKTELDKFEKNATDHDEISQGVEEDEHFQKVLLEEVENIIKSEKESVDWQKINETTPRRPVQQKAKHRKALLDPNNESLASEGRILRSRRELFPSQDSTPKRTQTKRSESYKLADIYERRLAKKAKNNHQAEADTLRLLKVASSYREHFEKYVMENARPFSSVSTAGLR